MTQDKPAEWAMKAALAAFDQPLPTDSIMLSVARAIEAADKAAAERERERSAGIAERDVDWVQFGKRDIEQWDGGPDAVRDYRLGIVAARAIAAAIRKGGDNDV